MSGDLILSASSPMPEASLRQAEGAVPAIVARAGDETVTRFLEFFGASIRNRNTRAAYLTAASKFFTWCEAHGLANLNDIRRLHVAAYIEGLTRSMAAPSVKQHLAGLRMLFSSLGVPRDNPAIGVRGPKHSVRTGRTPVLSAEQARTLLESIDTSSLSGLRDRAFIGLMIYTFARVSAIVQMQVEDYYLSGSRRWCRLHEKGGREHAVPAHHRAEEYVDEYMRAAGLFAARGPLFRTIGRSGELTDQPMTRFTAWEMMKRRSRAAGLPAETTNHTCRATGITVYLQNGGSIENARLIAAHASIKTTQTYDRRSEAITLDEISRIRL
jgi:integrase/recombinase XerD